MKKRITILIVALLLLAALCILVFCSRNDEQPPADSSGSPQDQLDPSDSSVAAPAPGVSEAPEEDPVVFDPPSPEEVSGNLSVYVPQKLDFDLDQHPQLKNPPTLSDILGDQSQTFRFDAADWSFKEDVATGKRYTDNEGNRLLLNNDGSATVSNCNALSDSPDAYIIGYKPDGTIEYFNSNHSSYETYSYHDPEVNDTLVINGTNSMIRVESVRYYYNQLEDGKLVSVTIVIEDLLNEEPVTREFLYDVDSNCIVETTLTLDNEQGVAISYTANYLPDGTLNNIIFTYGTDSHEGYISYTFNNEYTFVTEENIIQNG